ncbi:organic cation transporter protein-like isoform X1 [Argiope bruennichi]|uniref:Organic cation transporter protein like n=2 Tax=Argiope bruennichi TaxID=94029 RepID=A0A8T0FE02_ARGBR|nr:organic cation transporter protein-like isoform X1 [Argiope bruennichi]KAF8788625.1 Organic cation transporter protein like [Argiope bruennichi]
MEPKSTDKFLANGSTTSAENEASTTRDVTDIIGEYGPWQRLIFILTCLRGTPTAFYNLSTPFFAPKQDVWCAQPSFSNWSVAEWRNSAIPLEYHEGELVPSRCNMYEVLLVNDEPVINKNKTVPCSAWEYDNSFYTNTLTREYDLVCGRDWLISYTQFNYMAGMMCGVFIFGHLADRFGRRIILNISVTLMLIASVIAAFSPTFTFFSVARFFLALGVGGTQNTSFCLLMEVLGPIYRTRPTFAFSFGWAFGLLLLPGMTYLIRDWVYQQLASAAVSSILLSYWIFMPESPRWLMTQGKYEKAEKIMIKAAKRNNLEINNMPLMMKQLKERIERDERKKNPSVIDLFKTANLRKNTIFVYISYFSVAFVFYGLSLGQTNLGGNPFLNFFIGSAVELPAYVLCIIFIRYLRRKPSFLIFDIIGGLACFFMIPSDYTWIRLTAAMLGKLCISGAFIILAIHASEIFPTVVRTVGSGTSLMMGRIGAMVAPFIKELGNATHPAVPAIVYGSLSFVAAVLIALLPETYNQVLPDTICEAEELGTGLDEIQKITSISDLHKEKGDVKMRMLQNGKEIKDPEV